MADRVMKAPCCGCPFDYGSPATELTQNLGCLPSPFEVRALCREAGTAWACHAAPAAVCAGYAEEFPHRAKLPLQHMEGVHRV
jgi:hypothetical protein